MRLHPRCPACRRGDHEDCIDETVDGPVDTECACGDPYHVDEDEDEDADA